MTHRRVGGGGIGIALVLAAWLLPGTAEAGDWPCYRGPNKDGITSEGINRWPPVELWRANVGEGYSQVSVSGGRVYTAGWAGGQDTVYCFDENYSGGGTQSPLFTYSYSQSAFSEYNGTRATPTVDTGGSYVYMLSHEGRLSAFNKTTGAPAWNVTLTGGRPRRGYTSSPLIEGNLVIVNVGGRGAAVDKSNGSVVWGPFTGTAGYASPFAFTDGNQRTVVIGNDSSAVGVNPVNGAQLWRFDLVWRSDHQLMADPIIYNGQVWVSAPYNIGCRVAHLGSGTLTAVWSNVNMRNKVNCSVLYGGYVYGIDEGGSLRCIDFATGEVMWSQGGFGSESGLMIANGELVINDANGQGAADLVVATATSSGYSEQHRWTGITSYLWTVPVVSNGKMYVRNHAGLLVCYDVSASVPDTTPPTVNAQSAQLKGTATDDSGINPNTVNVAGSPRTVDAGGKWTSQDVSLAGASTVIPIDTQDASGNRTSLNVTVTK